MTELHGRKLSDVQPTLFHAPYRTQIASMTFTRHFAPLAALLVLACDSTKPEEPAVELGRRLLVNEQAACALDRTGAVHCWGTNSNFQEFGAPVSVIQGSPLPLEIPVPKLGSFAIGVGTHFCGIEPDADALCWGRGTFGQLGRGTLGSIGNAPAEVDGGIEWTQLSLGRISTCGLAVDGIAYCWGTNQRGEIGVDTVPLLTNSLLPRKVLDGEVKFRQVVAGWLHACGIATTGQTFCWGDNNVGQLGNGTADTLPRRIPTLVAGGHSFVQLTLSAKHSCGITTDGAAYCWGNNQFGQLGDGTTTDRHQPTRVSGDIAFAQIAAGSGFAGVSSAVAPSPRTPGGVAHTCALTPAGGAFCWGWNANGQVGDGSVTDRHVPTAVSGGLTFDVIGAGGSYSCGMRGNAVWCWGSNAVGQLGNGTTVPEPAPVKVGAPFDKP